MPKQSFAQETISWKRLTAAVARRVEEMPHLAAQAEELATLVDLLFKLQGRQKRLTAQLLIASRELREGLEDGRQLAGRLRSGVKQVYGFHAPRLLEFGTKPRRKTRRRTGDPSAPDSTEVPS